MNSASMSYDEISTTNEEIPKGNIEKFFKVLENSKFGIKDKKKQDEIIEKIESDDQDFDQ